MATVNIECDDSAYVAAATGNGILQNKSPSPLRVVFAANPPAVDVETYHILNKNEFFQIVSGVPAGNTYVRSQDGRSNNVAFSE